MKRAKSALATIITYLVVWGIVGGMALALVWPGL